MYLLHTFYYPVILPTHFIYYIRIYTHIYLKRLMNRLHTYDMDGLYMKGFYFYFVFNYSFLFLFLGNWKFSFFLYNVYILPPWAD
jgi:hypothetical protein